MIVVVCPSAAVTGGPEALHQLCDSLLRQGFDAAMLYLPGEYRHTPAEYSHYQVRTISESEVYPTDIVVIPEVMAGEVRRFSYARTVLWWLSVDNAPAEALEVPAFHVCQSTYAWHHVRKHGHQPMMLTDYVTSDFLMGNGTRHPWITVNPVKGADLIERFCALCPDIEVRRIQDMTRANVVELFQSSSVFVDFGHQPGRDRLPREAASCGAVVFVRDAGAARFRQDYQLPEWAFFDDDFLALGELLRAVLEDSSPYFDAQVLYRGGVAREQSRFDEQVRAFAHRFL